MKSTIASALAIIGLATVPAAANAAFEGAVDYDDSMQCAALYSLLASASEGSDEAVLQDMATRWLIYSMGRDGTEDGSKATEELPAMVDGLMMALDDTADEAAGEEFLTEGLDFCEDKQNLVADELEAIELE